MGKGAAKFIFKDKIKSCQKIVIRVVVLYGREGKKICKQLNCYTIGRGAFNTYI